MRALAVLWALALGSATSAAEPPPDQRFDHAMMMRFHMHQNFDLLRAIERLLIRGKLDDARWFAASLSTAPDEPEHRAWATHAARVRERAGALAKATSVNEALRITAKLAAACANCHAELMVSTEPEKLPKVPHDLPTVEARMARHRWAVDRLWEALLSSSETAWRQGLDVLSASPLSEPADRVRLARQLQQQAITARKQPLKTIDDRAASYGEILITCAACHTR